jgi:hypothetical protein
VVRIVGSRALGIFPHHTVGSSTRIGVCPVVIRTPTVRLAEIVGAGSVAIAAAAAITMRLRGRAAASGRPPPAVRPHAGPQIWPFRILSRLSMALKQNISRRDAFERGRACWAQANFRS